MLDENSKESDTIRIKEQLELGTQKIKKEGLFSRAWNTLLKQF